MTSGRLKQIGPGFTLDGSPFEILGATMFSLFYDWAYGGNKAFVDQQIVSLQQSSIRSPRIFVTVQDTAWSSGAITGYPVVLDPAVQASLYTRLRTFGAKMLAAGLYPIYVVFGSCQDGFTTPTERDTVCRNVALTLAQFPCLVEISPDPPGTDLGRDGMDFFAIDPFIEATRLVTIYKTGDINNPVASGGGSTASEIDQPLADWMGYHPVRSITNDKWDWIVDQVTNSCVQRHGNIRAVVADLPMCAGGNANPNNNDANVDHWWAWGLLCQFLQMGSCFHAEPLLGSQLVDSTIFAQLQAWRAGRLTVGQNDFPQFYIQPASPSPILVGNSPWTDTAALMVYGRHNGVIGMAVAMLTPPAWDPTLNLDPAWTAVTIEQRGDASLIGLMQA